MPFLGHATTVFAALLPRLWALTCLDHNFIKDFDNSALASLNASSLPETLNRMNMTCEGQQCFVQRNDIPNGTVGIMFYRGCLTGMTMKDGCMKFDYGTHSVAACYCRKDGFCNLPDPSLARKHTTPKTIQCADDWDDDDVRNCTSYECLYNRDYRTCLIYVEQHNFILVWLSYVWQNTCVHLRLETGLIRTDCRCNFQMCNDNLLAEADVMAINETYRRRPLVKCHYSFELKGVASNKFSCSGELCGFSEEKAVRTCVNVTDLGGAEPIILGLIHFGRRSYYLCDQPFCNWNASVALASLNSSWNPADFAHLIPFDQQNSASSFHLSLSISFFVMLLIRDL